MKAIFKIIAVCLSAAALFACAGAVNKTQEASYSSDSLTLDTAINEAASYFIRQLPAGAKLALVPFTAPTGLLSDYVFEEMWRRFEDSRGFVMVDRRSLQKIEAEIKYQYETGRVDDNAMVSITKQYGAEILVHGQMTTLGNEYRITIYATDVEKASSSQRALVVRPDSRLATLLNVSAEDEVERAISAMARSVDQRTTIAVGRISYTDTQTVSSFSAWLKNSIIPNAQKQRDRFQVATESEIADFAVASRGFTAESAASGGADIIQAVITGSYTPLDSGVEVLVQLVSTSGSRMVLASERLVIPASELERRRLSLLPETDNVAISKTAFETKQKAIDPYAGRNNRWAFTVSPDVLDGIYFDGDFMTLRVYSARDCYFRIIHVDVYGNTQVIYPTSTRDNNFIRSGETRRIPDNTRYRLGQPFGEELILASAYDRPFALSQQSGLLSAEDIIRGLTVENESHTEMNPSATARFSYTILPGF